MYNDPKQPSRCTNQNRPKVAFSRQSVKYHALFQLKTFSTFEFLKNSFQNTRFASYFGLQQFCLSKVLKDNN